MMAWDEANGQLLFRSRYEFRTMFSWVALAGLALVLGGGASWAVFGQDERAGALALTAAFIGAACVISAGLTRLTESTVVVDPAQKTVALDDSAVPFSEFGCIVTFETKERSGQSQSTLWVVGALPTSAIRDFHVQSFAEARELLVEHSTMGQGMLDHAAETLAMARLLAVTQPLPIGTYFEPARAWRAGEKLARTLNLPLLDLTGDPTLRRVDQLDTPLQTLLAREILPTRDPGALPPSLEVSLQGGLSMVWTRYNYGVLGIIAIVPVFLVPIFFLPEAWFFFLPFALFFALLAPVISVGYGPQTMRLDKNELSYRGFYKDVTLRLDQIEMIRHDERSNGVDFITDETTLRAHLPSTEAALWLKLRVENYLKALEG